MLYMYVHILILLWGDIKLNISCQLHIKMQNANHLLLQWLEKDDLLSPPSSR